MQLKLLELLPPVEPTTGPDQAPGDVPDGTPRPAVRVRTANRDQIELRACDLESLLPPAEGLGDMQRVAQDGGRVRANAGAASFRRRPSLDECLKNAEQQLKNLRRELEEDPAATSRRQAAARQRACEEREERVKRALAQMPKAEAKKSAADKANARVSTTDPDARVMKMG